MEFLNWELRRARMPVVHASRAVCTLELSRKKHPGAKHTLDALCNRYGIDLSVRAKHGALIDAELLARVYVELIGGRQIGFDLAAIVVDNVVAAPRHLQTARAHAASVEELARHAAFVGGLTNPIWLA